MLAFRTWVCMHMTGQFARAIRFIKLHEWLSMAQRSMRKIPTANMVAGRPVFAAPTPPRPIQSAMSSILGTVALTKTNRTCPLLRFFMREMTTSRVAPRVSLRIWTWDGDSQRDNMKRYEEQYLVDHDQLHLRKYRLVIAPIVLYLHGRSHTNT
jgi:hypothetical protein